MDRLSRFISAGQSIGYGERTSYSKGHVKSSEIINGRIRKYIVETSGRDVEVLIWADQRSNIIEAVDQYGLTDSATVNTAKDAFYKDITPISPLTEMSRSLPDVIYRKLMNSSDYGIIQNDELEIESVIDDFSDRIERYAETIADILSAYDDAINSCNAYTKHDLSWVSVKLIEKAERYSEYISEVTPDEFKRIICRRTNDLSRTWLLEPPFRIPSDRAEPAFLSLVSEKNVSDRDIAVMNKLLENIIDINYLARRMIGGTDYYYAERMMMREKKRGHERLAKELADCIGTTNDIKRHMREAALIRREFGLPDTDDYFIMSFIEEPNGKRLIDMKASHPGMDIEDTMTKAWRKHGKDPKFMSFFAENGFSANVVRSLKKRTQEDLRSEILNDRDDFEHLCLTLMKVREYEMSLRIGLTLLSNRIDKNDLEEIDHMIGICDRIVDAAGRPEELMNECISFRSANYPRKHFWRHDGWTAFQS